QPADKGVHVCTGQRGVAHDRVADLRLKAQIGGKATQERLELSAEAGRLSGQPADDALDGALPERTPADHADEKEVAAAVGALDRLAQRTQQMRLARAGPPLQRHAERGRGVVAPSSANPAEDFLDRPLVQFGYVVRRRLPDVLRGGRRVEME